MKKIILMNLQKILEGFNEAADTVFEKIYSRESKVEPKQEDEKLSCGKCEVCKCGVSDESSF